MKRILACLAAAAGIWLCVPSDASAYCIYNRTNANIEIKQITGGLGVVAAVSRGFHASLKPGGSSCCNWQNSDCNSGRKPTSMTGFVAYLNVQSSSSSNRYQYALCAGEVPADGWLEIHGRLPNASRHPYSPAINYGDNIECKRFTGRSTLVGAGSKRCLDVHGWADRNGANVVLWDCHGGMNQRWKPNEKGEIRGYGDRCLKIGGGTSKNGANVQMWECHGGANQKWKIDSGRLVGLGGRCVDALGGRTANGTKIIVWDCLGKSNQAWRIVKE